jgi:histone acetyltransferase (RNA polymerase elongator complex component)
MMVGLPASTARDEIKTAEFICNSGCDECRIYPTIVFKDTYLEQMARAGIYRSLSLEEAVFRSASVLEIFVKNSVNVLRIGLCDSENLHNDSTYFAGPNHAAIGELIIGEYYFRAISMRISETDTKDKILKLTVSKGSTSKVIGQQKKNKIRLLRNFELYSVKILESEDLTGFDFLCEVEERI